MGSEKIIIISYPGTLAGYCPREPVLGVVQWFKDHLWTFRINRDASSPFFGYYLFRGISRFKKKYPSDMGKLRFRFWGLIEDLNRKQVKSFGLDDWISFEGYFAKKESQRRMDESDMFFLPLEPRSKGQKPILIPQKLFEYLKRGKPILALIAEDSDCGDILKKSGLGIVCDPHDSEQIADALHQIASSFEAVKSQQQPDWEYIESNFSASNQTRRLVGIFTEVLSEKT